MNINRMLRSMKRSSVSSITVYENPDPISTIRAGRNRRIMARQESVEARA
jgi:hypothetical protein